jgi:hypothetical protein
MSREFQHPERQNDEDPGVPGFRSWKGLYVFVFVFFVVMVVVLTIVSQVFA